MTDRFSKAVSELEKKNPFSCESCDERYGHGDKREEDRREGREARSGDSREKRHGASLTDTIVKGDPTPFGS